MLPTDNLKDPKVRAGIAVGIAVGIAAGVTSVTELASIGSVALPPSPHTAPCPVVKLNQQPGTSWFQPPIAEQGLPTLHPVVCAVNVNNGNPVEQDFQLSGQITGNLPDGEYIALVFRPDPNMCGLTGDHGTGGYYFITQLDIGPWSYDAHIPHADQMPILRHYYFAQMTSNELSAFENAAQVWAAKNHKPSSEGYPGERELPGQALYHIDVQPYVPPEKRAMRCR